MTFEITANISFRAKFKPEKSDNLNEVINEGEETQSVEDTKALTHKMFIELNKLAMQLLSLGRLEEARTILTKLVKLCKTIAKDEEKLQ